MLSIDQIEEWLRQTDEHRLEQLWTQADAVRKAHVGDAVHLRGLIEISNYCVRRCAYCGLSVTNPQLERYRMTDEEILDCARQAHAFGYGTVVIQAGEDYGLESERVAGFVRAIKKELPLAVTLSLGERPEEDLLAWRKAGADRYLLRFETSDSELYARIHPPRPGRRTTGLICCGGWASWGTRSAAESWSASPARPIGYWRATFSNLRNLIWI